MIHEPESRLCYASISDVAIKSGALRRTLITIFPAYLRHFAHKNCFLGLHIYAPLTGYAPKGLHGPTRGAKFNVYCSLETERPPIISLKRAWDCPRPSKGILSMKSQCECVLKLCWRMRDDNETSFNALAMQTLRQIGYLERSMWTICNSEQSVSQVYYCNLKKINSQATPASGRES